MDAHHARKTHFYRGRSHDCHHRRRRWPGAGLGPKRRCQPTTRRLAVVDRLAPHQGACGPCVARAHRCRPAEPDPVQWQPVQPRPRPPPTASRRPARDRHEGRPDRRCHCAGRLQPGCSRQRAALSTARKSAGRTGGRRQCPSRNWTTSPKSSGCSPCISSCRAPACSCCAFCGTGAALLRLV
jgi:hypothetical protein